MLWNDSFVVVRNQDVAFFDLTTYEEYYTIRLPRVTHSDFPVAAVDDQAFVIGIGKTLHLYVVQDYKS